MSLRPKQQLLESPPASVNATTSSSIASTVHMASPSVRRSARIQDSPSVSYRDSLRSSVMRDTPVRQLGRRRSRSRSRIFGLDASDRSRLDRNSDSEIEEEGGRNPILASNQQLLMSKVVPFLTSPRGKGVAASLLLLLMLVFTQWVVGQGMTPMVTWVMGPLSGLRMAVMSLPEMLIGSVGRKVEINEMDLLVRMMNSDKMKEVVESVTKERMWEMGKEVDRKIRKEMETVNEEVETFRKIYLENEIKRLAMREEELRLDKSRKDWVSDAEGMEFGQDVRQKLELLEIQVEQIKLGLIESDNQLRDRKDVSELEEEMGIMRRVVEKLSKEREVISELEQKLGMMEEEVDHLNDRNMGVTVSKLAEELESVKTLLEKVGGQGSNVEIVKEVLGNMMADPLSTLYEKVGDQQKEETDRLEIMVMEVIVKLNQTEPKLANTITEKVDRMKHSLEEELVQHTESLHKNWSKFYEDNSVSLPKVTAMLESQLSLFSADRTGQVDWASLSLGGNIISTPHTTTHPTPGQVLTLLGVPIWQVSYTPRQILQPYSGAGQCWAFSGMSGQVVMQLGQVVRVTGVTIEHIRPSPDLSSAPRNIVVWDHENNTSLLNITYSISTSSLSVQTFPIPDRTSLPISKLRLEVTSNWGHTEYTCLYRVRVHGIQVVEEDNVIKVTEQVSDNILM